MSTDDLLLVLLPTYTPYASQFPSLGSCILPFISCPLDIVVYIERETGLKMHTCGTGHQKKFILLSCAFTLAFIEWGLRKCIIILTHAPLPLPSKTQLQGLYPVLGLLLFSSWGLVHGQEPEYSGWDLLARERSKSPPEFCLMLLYSYCGCRATSNPLSEN